MNVLTFCHIINVSGVGIRLLIFLCWIGADGRLSADCSFIHLSEEIDLIIVRLPLLP